MRTRLLATLNDQNNPDDGLSSIFPTGLRVEEPLLGGCPASEDQVCEMGEASLCWGEWALRAVRTMGDCLMSLHLFEKSQTGHAQTVRIQSTSLVI